MSLAYLIFMMVSHARLRTLYVQYLIYNITEQVIIMPLYSDAVITYCDILNVQSPLISIHIANTIALKNL